MQGLHRLRGRSDVSAENLQDVYASAPQSALRNCGTQDSVASRLLLLALLWVCGHPVRGQRQRGGGQCLIEC